MDEPRHSLAVVLHAHACVLDNGFPHEGLLKLLALLRGWESEEIPGAISICLSPLLLQQLSDPSQQARFERALDTDMEEAEAALGLPGIDHMTRELRRRRRDEVREMRLLWRDGCERHLISAFRALHRAGRIELLGSAASHAILPLATRSPSGCGSQVRIGLREFERFFGEPAQSFWLPHGAFEPGIDDVLAHHQVKNFVAAAEHPFAPSTGSWPRRCPSGAIAFAADPRMSGRLLAPDTGYANTGTNRAQSHRGGEESSASAQLRAQATHFMRAAAEDFAALPASGRLRAVHVLPVALDDLATRWEAGLLWLDKMVRQSAWEQDEFALRTLCGARETLQLAEEGYPPTATVDADPGFARWVCGANDWIYPYLDAARARLQDVARAIERPRGTRVRVLDQAIRELLLAENSDLALAMAEAPANPDRGRRATARFREHLDALHRLLTDIERDRIDTHFLARREGTNTTFPVLDYRDFARAEARS